MDFDNPRIPQFNYRTGDILIPEVKFAEPLRVEAEHFADCIAIHMNHSQGYTTRELSFRSLSARDR